MKYAVKEPAVVGRRGQPMKHWFERKKFQKYNRMGHPRKYETIRKRNVFRRSGRPK